jgi:hypothetical protein
MAFYIKNDSVASETTTLRVVRVGKGESCDRSIKGDAGDDVGEKELHGAASALIIGQRSNFSSCQ